MAVTNNVLNAINVFSSTSVFNSNKGSVGANDLNFIKQTTAELATEGGGIIAQSLGTNGYVKFANGLILQWGVANAPVTFPLSFPDTCLWVQPVYNANSQESGAAWYTCYANNITPTGFTNGRNQGVSTRWFAIGK